MTFHRPFQKQTLLTRRPDRRFVFYQIVVARKARSVTVRVESLHFLGFVGNNKRGIMVIIQFVGFTEVMGHAWSARLLAK